MTVLVQASTWPAATCSGVIFAEGSVATAPLSTTTRHLPQTPLPPQVALTCTPARIAARSRLSPAATSTSRCSDEIVPLACQSPS